MRILYYDCFLGISGDMNLGALIDVGVDPDYFMNEVSKLNLQDEYEIRIKKELKKGINGNKVEIIPVNRKQKHPAENLQSVKTHEHSHDHEQEPDQHCHRNLKDIEEIIRKSLLPEQIKELSLKIFMVVATAEAKIHGLPVQDVHFHEVGAIDSIVDIVGAAICLDYLQVDRILSSPVQIGGGFVHCAHGLIPVPAPATAEILKGIPIRSGLVRFETATPTGAAILAATVEEFTDQTEFIIDRIGYGIGSRDLEIPNVLRVYLGHAEEKNIPGAHEQYILETNIDDMNPELYSYVEERLLEKGAADVYKTPIIMKKGRPAVKLSILVDKERENEMLEIVFKETTSLGVRRVPVDKIMLERDFIQVSTRYGEVTVKNTYFKGKLIRFKPEYEDCRRLALEFGVPIAAIYREVNKNYRGEFE